MKKETQFKAVYKGNDLKDVSIRYKKEMNSGFIWAEEKLSDIADISDVIEIKKDYDYEGKPTISIRTYGKLEEIFQ